MKGQARTLAPARLPPKRRTLEKDLRQIENDEPRADRRAQSRQQLTRAQGATIVVPRLRERARRALRISLCGHCILDESTPRSLHAPFYS